VKAVMYHYVRPEQAAPPHFRHLPLDGFRRQLDHFAASAHIASAAEFEHALDSGEPAPESIVLTFDDGLRDHHDHVLPELRARGLWGIFFVSTLPYTRREVLDVHKVHLALGRAGGRAVLRELESLIGPEMLEPEYVERLDGSLYRGHVEDAATAQVKRLLNYHLRLEHRSRICHEVFLRSGGNEAEDLAAHYLSAEQLRLLREQGMWIGGHSGSHRLWSQLSLEAQAHEVRGSLGTLAELLGERIRGFCYPYGGDHSFNADTLGLLEVAGVEFAFSVEPRDIGASDLRRRRLALPRYDCNVFPHGLSRRGRAPEPSQGGEAGLR
jgi:peptidoglycan/xylan/chitin deacetylase (PgdA/CDA1 family)